MLLMGFGRNRGQCGIPGDTLGGGHGLSDGLEG